MFDFSLLYTDTPKEEKLITAEIDKRVHSLCGKNARKILRDERGKPFLSEGLPFISYSHAQRALLTAACDRPIGADAEFKKHRDFRKLAKRYFDGEEAELIEKAPLFARDNFYALWTMKESYLKMTGTGLAGLGGTCFVKDGKLTLSVPECDFILLDDGKYMCSLCLQKPPKRV